MNDPIILQFDDDDSYFTVAEIICFNMGLKITATARDIASTRNLIASIEAKKLNPNIAIISDYLGNNYDDGRKLAKKLREIAPELKIIAYVTDPDTDWGDFLAIKSGKDANTTLLRLLEELTGKKFVASNIQAS